MTEFFKNFEPFCKNFRKFRNHVYEFCGLEDARSIQISSFVINSEKGTHLQELRLKTDPYVGREFQVKSHPYERHFQYHLTIKYPPEISYGLFQAIQLKVTCRRIYTDISKYFEPCMHTDYSNLCSGH